MAASKIMFHDEGVIQVCEVVLSYPHLFKPFVYTKALKPGEEPGAPKYSGVFLAKVTTHKEEIKALHAVITKFAQENNKAPLPADKYFLRDGNLTLKPEQAGCWTISVSEETKPKVVDRDGQTVLDDNPVGNSKIYAGAIVNVFLRMWWQSNKWGKRVNANLLGVQWVAHGEKIAGNRPDVSGLFQDMGPGEVAEMGTDDFQL